jgi:hypothetical protein
MCQWIAKYGALKKAKELDCIRMKRHLLSNQPQQSRRCFNRSSENRGASVLDHRRLQQKYRKRRNGPLGPSRTVSAPRKMTARLHP